MKKLCVFVLFATFLSCTRQDPNCCEPPCCDPVKPAIFNFLNKYQVCDSIRTTTGITSILTPVGKGKGFDVKYASNGTYELYSSPPVTYQFEPGSVDTIYYWAVGATKQANQFRLIKTNFTDKIQYRETEAATGKIIDLYYTAEP